MRDINIAWARVLGTQPSTEVVLRIGKDDMFQQDFSRSDGPQFPNGREPSKIWLNDKILAFFCHLLANNDNVLCKLDKKRKSNYFADSYFYTTMMQDQRTDGQKGVYSYNDIVGRCKKVSGGNLLKVGATYLPVLLNGNHWVVGAILTEWKEIILYNPSGKDTKNTDVLHNLLQLVRDELKRTGDYNKEEGKVFLGRWALIDVAIDQATAYHHQENSKCHANPSFFSTKFAPHLPFLCGSISVLDYDCRIFTFLFMALHSQGVSMYFCQNDVHVYKCCEGHGVWGKLAHVLWKINELGSV